MKLGVNSEVKRLAQNDGRWPIKNQPAKQPSLQHSLCCGHRQGTKKQSPQPKQVWAKQTHRFHFNKMAVIKRGRRARSGDLDCLTLPRFLIYF